MNNLKYIKLINYSFNLIRRMTLFCLNKIETCYVHIPDYYCMGSFEFSLFILLCDVCWFYFYSFPFMLIFYIIYFCDIIWSSNRQKYIVWLLSHMNFSWGVGNFVKEYEKIRTQQDMREIVLLHEDFISNSGCINQVCVCVCLCVYVYIKFICIFICSFCPCLLLQTHWMLSAFFLSLCAVPYLLHLPLIA